MDNEQEKDGGSSKKTKAAPEASASTSSSDMEIAGRAEGPVVPMSAELPISRELAASKEDVGKLAKRVHLAIHVIAALLALLFAFLVLNESELTRTIVDSASPTNIIRVGLFVYYTSWVFGAKFDVDIEERVYIADPQRGSIDLKALSVLLMFSVIAILFFWAHDKGFVFSIFLVVFIIANILGFWIVSKRIQGPAMRSIEQYRSYDDHAGTELVRTVIAYMSGNWQKYRFACMVSLAVLLVALFGAVEFGGIANMAAGVSIQGLSAQRLVELSPGFLFVFYVLFAEGWMWLRRAETHSKVAVIEQLATQYHVIPREQDTSKV